MWRCLFSFSKLKEYPLIQQQILSWVLLRVQWPDSSKTVLTTQPRSSLLGDLPLVCCVLSSVLITMCALCIVQSLACNPWLLSSLQWEIKHCHKQISRSFTLIPQVLLNKNPIYSFEAFLYNNGLYNNNKINAPPPSLLVEGRLSKGSTPSSFYFLVELGLTLHLDQANIWWEIDQLFIKRHHIKIWNKLN